MKKQCLTFVFALTCVLSLSVGLEAQSRHEFKVNVPFDFLAVGKNMPAGTYAVSRVMESGLSGLQLTSEDGKASVMVLPTEFISADSAAVKVGFERVGGEPLLSYVVTEDGTYNISTAKSAEVVTRMKQSSEGNAGGR